MIMKETGVKPLLCLFILTATVTVRADVIVNNLNQPTQSYLGPIGDDSTTNDFLIGQEFTLPPGVTPYQLNQITLLLNPTGGGANITVSVWQAGPDNNPTNEVGVVASRFVANAGNIDFVPSTNITLPPGIYYAVAAPTTHADSGFVGWAYAVNTNWVGSGTLVGYAETSAGTWENVSITNLPQQLSVLATPMTATVGINQQGGITTLSWPSTLNGYVSETTTNLASPVWQQFTKVPMLVAGDISTTNRWNDPARFFRLRQSFVADNLEQPTGGWDGPIGTDANSNDFLIGQEFTLSTGSYNLNKVTLLLNPVNGDGSVTVSVWQAGPDNNPTNEIAVVGSQTVTNEGPVDFVPSSPIALMSGGYYVVAAPSSSADNAKVGWDWTFSTTWTGFGTLARLADTYPGVWENAPIAIGPYQMSIQVTPATP